MPLLLAPNLMMPPAAVMARVAAGGTGTAMPLRQSAALGGIAGRETAEAKRQQAKATAPEVEALMNPEPTGMEKTMKRVEGAGWNAVNAEFFPFIAGGALGGVVKGADWLRGKKIPFTQVPLFPGALSTEKPGALTKFSRILHVPSRVMNSATLGDLASPGTLRDIAKGVWQNREMNAQDFEATRLERFDQHAATTDNLLKATEGPGKGLRFATTHATTLGNNVQQGINTVNRLTGRPLTRLQAAAQNRGRMILAERALPAATQLESVLQHAALHEHLPADALKGVQEAVSGLKPLLNQKTSALATSRLAEGTQAVNSAVSSLRSAVSAMPTVPKELGQAMSAVEKQATAVTKQAAAAGKWFNRFGGWRGVGASLANLPKVLRGMPLAQGVMGAAFLAGGAAQLAGTLSHRHQDKAGISLLENDMRDLPAGALADEMRGALQQASKMSRRHSLTEGALGLGTTALSMRMLKGGGMAAIMPLMALQMGGGAVVDIVAGRSQFPQLYNALTQSHGKGQQLTAAHYGTLINMVLPHHLERVKTDNAVLGAVMDQYMKEQLSPKQVLHDVASGGFDARAAHVKESLAAMRKSAAAAPAPSAPRAVVGKHTQALAGAPAPQIAVPSSAVKTAASTHEVPGAQVMAMSHDGRLDHAAQLAMGG